MRFDEFPADEHLRTPEEQQRYSLDVARSNFAVEMFDDIILNFTRETATLVRRGEIVGEVHFDTIPKLGGTA